MPSPPDSKSDGPANLHAWTDPRVIHFEKVTCWKGILVETFCAVSHKKEKEINLPMALSPVQKEKGGNEARSIAKANSFDI